MYQRKAQQKQLDINFQGKITFAKKTSYIRKTSNFAPPSLTLKYEIRIENLSVCTIHSRVFHFSSQILSSSLQSVVHLHHLTTIFVVIAPYLCHLHHHIVAAINLSPPLLSPSLSLFHPTTVFATTTTIPPLLSLVPLPISLSPPPFHCYQRHCCFFLLRQKP